MDKINLMDVDFVIPIRIDSVNRIENLLAGIDYLQKYFYTNIYVLEAAQFNNHILENLLPDGIVYYFFEDWDPIFHRTKYINILSEGGTATNIAIWDADVIVDHHQIVDAVMSLRDGIADVSYPYDGHFYDTTPIVRSVFIKTHEFSVLADNIGKMLLPYGSDMGGGAIIVNRDKFREAGREDEAFYGWGPEDWNRIEKWKKLGYKIKKMRGPLFHLSHPRDINGRLNSKWQTRYAHNILRQTQHGSADEITRRLSLPKIVQVDRKGKLHIGCGSCLLPSWINTDIKPCSKDVTYLDITKPFPYLDESFEYVFAEHVCEHISFENFLSAMGEVFRILKPGGVFRVAMPSFEFLMKLYHDPDSSSNSRYIRWSIGSFASEIINNIQLDLQDLAVITINNFMHNWGHKFIYNATLIENLLISAGFKNVRRCSVGESSHEALRNIEQHGTQIPVWANYMETLVWEAEK